jgi:16S rRNA (guanine527-N7)-methyltransferase
MMIEMPQLYDGLQKLGICLTQKQAEQFSCYRKELLNWNQKVNLTSITDQAEVERLHFLDSVTSVIAEPNLRNMGLSVCDVGSGAGFPGVPLKILFPFLSLTLIDSTAKRTDFLHRLLERLGIEDVKVVTSRAELCGHNSDLREAFDLVVSRAVARIRVVLEYTLPLCKVGGQVVLPKKGDITAEVSAARGASLQLGGSVIETAGIPTDIFDDQRLLVSVRKVHSTPDRYPRAPGVPSKRPL